ncbi:hypothetical protein Ddc_20700 [Ditylenchus destructor]|nr:hypothetical protein Ddc_20700 [Ditylenchus destructor]
MMFVKPCTHQSSGGRAATSDAGGRPCEGCLRSEVPNSRQSSISAASMLREQEPGLCKGTLLFEVHERTQKCTLAQPWQELPDQLLMEQQLRNYEKNYAFV